MFLLRFSIPYTLFKELRPELLEKEYETDSGNEDEYSYSDTDISSFGLNDDDEFNLDGFDIDENVPFRG